MNKFKRDDIVERYGEKYKVMKILLNKKYLVVDMRSNLDHVFEEADLKFWNGNLQYNTKNIEVGKTCPRCGTPWNISGFGATKWYDCIKCSKRAEDLVFSSTFEESDNFGNTMDENDLQYLLDNLYGGFKP